MVSRGGLEEAGLAGLTVTDRTGGRWSRVGLEAGSLGTGSEGIFVGCFSMCAYLLQTTALGCRSSVGRQARAPGL